LPIYYNPKRFDFNLTVLAVGKNKENELQREAIEKAKKEAKKGKR
jgi:hypothetical protein